MGIQVNNIAQQADASTDVSSSQDTSKLNPAPMTNQERITKFNSALNALYNTKKFKNLPPEYKEKVRGMVYDKVVPKFFAKLGDGYKIPTKEQWLGHAENPSFMARQIEQYKDAAYIKGKEGDVNRAKFFELTNEAGLAATSQGIKAIGGLIKIAGAHKQLKANPTAIDIAYDEAINRAVKWTDTASNEYDQIIEDQRDTHATTFANHIATGGARLGIDLTLWNNVGKYLEAVPLAGKAGSVGTFLEGLSTKIKSGQELVKVGKATPELIKGLAQAKVAYRLAETFKLGVESFAVQNITGHSVKESATDAAGMMAGDIALRGMAKPVKFMSKYIFNKVLAVGGPRALTITIEQGLQLAETGTNKAQNTLLEHPVKGTAQLIEQFAQTKFGKSYKDLNWAQRKHIANNLMSMIAQNASNVVIDNPEVVEHYVAKGIETQKGASKIATASADISDKVSKASSGKSSIQVNTENALGIAKRLASKKAPEEKALARISKVKNDIKDSDIPSVNSITKELVAAAKSPKTIKAVLSSVGAAKADSPEFLQNLLNIKAFKTIFAPEDLTHKLLMMKMASKKLPAEINNFVDMFIKQELPDKSPEQIATMMKNLEEHLNKLRISKKLGTEATSKFGMKVFRSTNLLQAPTQWQQELAEEIADAVPSKSGKAAAKSVNKVIKNAPVFTTGDKAGSNYSEEQLKAFKSKHGIVDGPVQMVGESSIKDQLLKANRDYDLAMNKGQFKEAEKLKKVIKDLQVKQ